MIFYCPDCWKELPTDEQVCPNCGAELSSWGGKKYSDKLLRALSHPEPETQRRAIYLLGENRIREAIVPLAELFRRSPNPFLQGEVVEAVGKIGGESAVSLLTEALRHPSFIVRGEAVKSLTNVPSNGVVKRALECALKDPSFYVRETAREAIAELGKD